MKKSDNQSTDKSKIVSAIRSEISFFMKTTDASSRKRPIMSGTCQILQFKKPRKHK